MCSLYSQWLDSAGCSQSVSSLKLLLFRVLNEQLAIKGPVTMRLKHEDNASILTQSNESVQLSM